MRTLDEIQSDISFVTKRKNTFFSRVFGFNSSRFDELQEEEFKAIDKLLFETNAEYKELAQTNLKPLDNLTWALKVIESTHTRNSFTFTSGLCGEINNKGQMFCDRISSVNLLVKKPLEFAGSIDYFGRVSVKAVESELAFSTPTFYHCFVTTNGQLTFEMSKEKYEGTTGCQIIRLAGEPFYLAKHKKDEFLLRRKQMYRLIDQHKQKAGHTKTLHHPKTMTKNITLTKTEKDDLNAFFEFQLDKEANYLAAFTSKDPNDKAAYIEKYAKFLNDPTINMRTIKVNDVIVGSIAKFIMGNEAGITYWIDKKFWGQGIATTALKYLLAIEKTRPIFGHVAFDNYGSQKVLEKCGFVKIGKDKGFANARQAEIEEYIYKLSD